MEFLAVNQNDITRQSLTLSLEHDRYVEGATTTTGTDKQMETYVQNIYDTNDDWFFDAHVLANSAITGSATVNTCLVEYGYIP